MRRESAVFLVLFFISAAMSSAPQQPTPPRPKQGSGPATASPKSPPKKAPVSEAEFQKLKVQAEAARDTDQTAEAIALYSRLVALRPDWAEGWWHVGALHYDRDEFEAGVTAFRKFVVLQPDNGQGWGMLGLCEYGARKYAEALQHLTRARTVGLGGNDDLARVVRFHQALLFIRGEQYEAARGILHGFAVEARESPQVLEAFGRAALRMAQPPDASDPDQQSMILRVGKAAFLEAERKGDDALRLYAGLAEEFVGKPNVAYAYASALAGQGFGAEAVRYFEQELKLNPSHVPAMLQLSLELISLTRSDEALTYAKQAVQLEPDNPIPYYLQGRILLARNEPQVAVGLLEKAKSLAPRFAQPRYLLAQAYQRTGKPDAARREKEEFERLKEAEKERQGRIGTFTLEEFAGLDKQPDQ